MLSYLLFVCLLSLLLHNYSYTDYSHLYIFKLQHKYLQIWLVRVIQRPQQCKLNSQRMRHSQSLVQVHFNLIILHTNIFNACYYQAYQYRPIIMHVFLYIVNSTPLLINVSMLYVFIQTAGHVSSYSAGARQEETVAFRDEQAAEQEQPLTDPGIKLRTNLWISICVIESIPLNVWYLAVGDHNVDNLRATTKGTPHIHVHYYRSTCLRLFYILLFKLDV
jgi:hypothetical protein